MSADTVTYVTIVACALLGVAAYVALILVPAWTAYSRLWERLVASVLSVYALAAFIGIGLCGGLAIIWFWDGIIG